MTVSRRRFLFSAAAIAASGSSAARAGSAIFAPTVTFRPLLASQANGFRSRPDLNGAPTLSVLSSSGVPAPGYLFVTPWVANGDTGAAIFDNAGQLVFYRPSTVDQATNLQVVEYQGQPMLAWWEGSSVSTYGQGVAYLYSSAYELVATIGSPDNPIDLHELVVTPAGTALAASYVTVPYNLAAIGGASAGLVLDWQLSEISIADGAVLWSWHALDHVPLLESVVPPPSDSTTPFDYFHGNSVDITPDGGHLIISARNTSSVYKVERATGSILWRLRGANDGFVPANPLALLPAGESFWYQHDARIHPDGTLSVFDDGGAPFVHNARGLVLAINESGMTATIQRQDDGDIPVSFMGSYRSQSNGDWLAGWGNVPRLTEFGLDGSVVLDMAISNYSYRALRFEWDAVPAAPPDVAAERAEDGTVNVWASWNGATGVASWEVLCGPSPTVLTPIATFARAGFETAMTVVTAQTAIAVTALDANGNSLATSAAVAVAPLPNRVIVPMVASDS